jgi:formate/nitrite transporter
MSQSQIQIDALLPAEMATRAEYLGVRKAEAPALYLFALAVLAGAFIGLGGLFATVVSSGSFTVTSLAEGAAAFSVTLPYGITRLLAGLVFTLGLVLVIVGGAELFTGNSLVIMAWASRKVSTRGILRNWGIVYAGNLLGAVGTAVLVFLARQYALGGGAPGVTALNIAVSKVSLGFWQAIFLGILCNALVCMAVWLTYSARSTIDKIAAIILPIAAFVAAGFEHSVANMYFIPYALFIKDFDPAFVLQSGVSLSGMESLTWQSFFVDNLLPVTIGNIIGGTVLVAAVYWAVFLRKRP